MGIVVDPTALAPWTQAFWTPFEMVDGRTERELSLRRRGSLVQLDTPAGSRICPEADVAPLWDTAMRHALRRMSGPALLHAALLTDPAGRSVLVTGRSGSGKSTLTRTLVARGWRYGSDELVRIESEGARGIPRALEWPPGVDAAALRPSWTYSIRTADAVFGHLSDALETAVVPWRRLKAVVRLEIEGDRLQVRPSPPGGLKRVEWLESPRVLDLPKLLRLFARPWWTVRRGTPQETADAVAMIVVAGS